MLAYMNVDLSTDLAALLLRGTLAARFSDAQCGFKAIRKDVAGRLLPHVEDTGWFFDTELLVLAERPGSASTRCRWSGSTTPTAGSTSSPPRWPTSRASSGSAGRWPPAPSRSASCAPSSAGRRSSRPPRGCRLA